MVEFEDEDEKSEEEDEKWPLLGDSRTALKSELKPVEGVN